MSTALVTIRDLVKHFPIYGGIIPHKVGRVLAVDGVSFEIKNEITLGLVGETGCGKTTLGMLILRLIDPTSGEVYFEGKNIYQLRGAEMRAQRRKMQMVFQDPSSSLDPRMNLKSIVYEAINKSDQEWNKNERKERFLELIEMVGLSSDNIPKYPHQLSGGEKQRVAIARALAIEPKLIVADEPVSSLDVSIRAQILNLIKDLQKKFGLTVLYISHDLSSVRYLCDETAVMYLGKLVEFGSTKEIYDNPLHPYTQALISAVPIPDPKIKRKHAVLKGEVPSPINPPKGCRFHPRCSICDNALCTKEEPHLVNMRDGRLVACHLRS